MQDWDNFTRQAFNFVVEKTEKIVEAVGNELTAPIDEMMINFHQCKALIHSIAGDDQGELEEYNQALQSYPNKVELYCFRGSARHKLGDYQGALEDYNQGLQLKPTEARCYYVYYKRSCIRHALGDNQGAIEDCNMALRLYSSLFDYYISNWAKTDYSRPYLEPDSFIINDWNEAYIMRAIARHTLGDTQEAIQDCNEAIRHEPKNSTAYFTRGVIYSCLGEYPGAIGDFSEAIGVDFITDNYEYRVSFDPKADSYYRRGATYYYLGNYQRAIEDLTQALRLDPNLWAAYYNRGNAKYDLGDESGALQDYNQAQVIAPDPEFNSKDEHGYYGRALARSRMGDNSGALEDLNKAATLCSEHRNTALHQRVQEMIRTFSD